MTIKLNKAIVLDVTIISQSERSKQINCVKPDLQPRFRTRHFVLNKVENKLSGLLIQKSQLVLNYSAIKRSHSATYTDLLVVSK